MREHSLRFYKHFYFYFFLLTGNAFAQMTLPSVFPDMKSINPAVIALRKSGMIKFAASQDKIEKNQKLKTLNGGTFNADQKDEITINNINIFKGGKGGGTTSEWMIDYTQGKLDTTFLTATETSQYDQTATSIYAKYAWGFASRWGLQVHYVSYQAKYKYDINVGGTTASDQIDMTIMLPGVRIGKIMGSPALSLGLIAEVSLYKNDTKTDDPTAQVEGGGIKPLTIIGAALGSGGPNGVIELGLEIEARPPEKDLQTGESRPIPMKGSLILERRFGKLILGYKGMYFLGNFMDFDRVIPIQLVYSNSGSAGRLENSFNFSLGSDKGLSLGGSIFASNTKTQEKSGVFSSTEKHDTTTKLFGVSVRLGYVY